MQSLRDFLSQVAHKKAEYEQAQANLASKMEKVRNAIESIKTRLELKFEEVNEQIESIRREVFSKFDKKWEDALSGVDDSARVLEERAELFDQLLEKMSHTRNGKQVDGEGVLRFWLEAQTELETLETESETKGERALLSFERLSKTMSTQLDRAMEISAISVFQPLRSYFQEIVEGNTPKILPQQRVSQKQNHTSKRSIVDQSEHANHHPAVDIDHIENRLLSKINEKRKKVQLDMDTLQNGWDRQESARSSIERGYGGAYHTDRYLSHDYGQHYDHLDDEQSSSTKEIRWQPKLAHGTPLRRPGLLNYSKTPQSSGQTPNFYDALLLSKYRTPANRSSGQLRVPESRPSFQQTPHRGSRTFSGEQGVDKAPSSSELHAGGGRTHSGWYLESMKTINELKNFRETVRNKLSVVGSHAQSSGALARSHKSSTNLHLTRPNPVHKYSQYY